MADKLKIEIVLFNPPFGSPLARGSHFPQPSLIFDSGGKARGEALAVAHMLAASVWISMPRGARWNVHVDEEFFGVIAAPHQRTTKRRVWIELQHGDDVQYALRVLQIVATREQPKAAGKPS